MDKNGDALLYPKPLSMKHTANYETGAIVSKAFIDKRSGTVTFFAFDEGEGLGEHVSPFDAMACILDGEAEIKISGRKFTVTEGEMIIMPASKPYSIKAKQKFKMLLIMIRA